MKNIYLFTILVLLSTSFVHAGLLDMITGKVTDERMSEEFFLKKGETSIRYLNDIKYEFTALEVVDGYCNIKVNNEEVKINMDQTHKFSDFELTVFDTSWEDGFCGIEVFNVHFQECVLENNFILNINTQTCCPGLNVYECKKGECDPTERICAEIYEYCGDGIVQQDEECDDGNEDYNDGCFGCMVEELEPVCGDGYCDSGENCEQDCGFPPEPVKPEKCIFNADFINCINFDINSKGITIKGFNSHNDGFYIEKPDFWFMGDVGSEGGGDCLADDNQHILVNGNSNFEINTPCTIISDYTSQYVELKLHMKVSEGDGDTGIIEADLSGTVQDMDVDEECGNDICEENENIQSCPEDCKNTDKIIFTEDFSDVSEWTFYNENDQVVNINEGSWILTNEQLSGSGHVWANAGDNSWEITRFDTKVQMKSGGVHVNFLMNDDGRYYVSLSEERIGLHRQYDGWEIFEELEYFEDYGLEPNKWYDLRIELNYGNSDNHIVVYLDNTLVIVSSHMPIYEQGHIAFETLDDSNYWFDDVVVYGEKLEPVCGDGVCDNREICPQDCDICNDNDICDEGENNDNCPTDCYCGNGFCDSDENEETCPKECFIQDVIFEDFFNNGLDQWNIWIEECSLLEGCWNIIEIDEQNILHGQTHSWINAGSDDWKITSLEQKVQIKSGGVHINFLINEDGRYYISLSENGISLHRQYNNWNTFEEIEPFNEYYIDLNTWYNLKIILNMETNPHIDVYLDGIQIISSNHIPLYESGYIAFETLDNSEYLFDDVVVTGTKKYEETGCFDNVWNGEEKGVDCGEVCELDCCSNNHFDKNLGECDVDMGGECRMSCIWEKTNGPSGGKTVRIAIDPDDNNILYTGIYPISIPTTDGGVFVSYDKGLHWTDKSKGIDNKEIWAVEVDSNNRNTIFAGSNDGDIYKSVDRAENWIKVKNRELEFETIFSIEVDPENSDVILAGSRYGNIYRSEDGGLTWETISDSKGLDTGGAISSIQFSPYDHNIVFATSGFMDVWDLDSKYGVFKSINNGKSWKPVPDGLEENVNFGDTAFDSINNDIVYAVSGLIGEEWGGLFKSEDLGETWTNIRSGAFSSVEVHPSNSDIIYVGGEGMSVWKSTDGGLTWDYKTTGVMTSDNGGSFITYLNIDRENPETIYVATYAAGNYKTTDDGETWQEINDNIYYSYSWSPVPDYSGENNMLISSFTNGLHHTTGDLNWERILNNNLGINGLRRMVTTSSDPNLIYGMGDRGQGDGTEANFEEFRISTDKGKNWRVINLPISVPTNTKIFRDPTRKSVKVDGKEVFSQGEITITTTTAYVNSVAIDPLNPSIAYVATINNGMYKTNDKGNSWKQINNGLDNEYHDIRTVAIDPFDTSRIYIGANGDNAELFYSDDSGERWNKLNDDFTFTTIHASAVDPNNEKIVYTCPWGAGIFKSDDAGNSWIKMSGDSWGEPFSITSININPKNSKQIYATERSEPTLWYSDNGGDSWMSWGLDSDKYFRLNSFEFDPNDPSIYYVSGWKVERGQITGDLYRFTDFGNNEIITKGLPRAVLDIEVDPQNSNTIFVSTHVHGVYKSTDAGSSWTRIDSDVIKADSLPRVGVFDLAINDNKLYAATGCGQLPPDELIDLPQQKGDCGIYVSSDKGEVWSAIHNGIPDDNAIKALAFKSSDIIYAATNNGLYISYNGGKSWKSKDFNVNELSTVSLKDNKLYVGTHGGGMFACDVDDYGKIDSCVNNGPFAEIYNVQIEIDPSNSDIIYATSFPGGVFKSIDKGKNWNEKNFALPSFQLEDPDRAGYYNLRINENNPSELYLAIFGKGIYRSKNSAETWTPINFGLENKEVYGIGIDPAGEYVYAATNGVSVFRAKTLLKSAICGNNICDSGETPNSCPQDCEETCICTIQYDPVCGINGKTYSNSCSAGCENIDIECKGECPCQVNECSGCLNEGICIPYGVRRSGEYCDLTSELEKQKTSNKQCDNNFECTTNLCINDKCVSRGIWEKFVEWFSRFM